MSSSYWTTETPPRVAVLGAGAIGGWLAAALARAGWTVQALARGASLSAMRADGLTLLEGDRRSRLAVLATDEPAAIAGADLLLLGLKGHDLPGAVPLLRALLGPRTVVLSIQNGLPWWFLRGFGGPAQGWTLAGVDPGGALAALLPTERVLAGVAHAAAQVAAPGVVRLMGQDRLLLGDPTGRLAAPLAALLAAFQAGGVAARPTDDIRGEIWAKLWGNASMNPLSALARADTAALLDDAGTASLALAMMAEMAAIGERIGLRLDQTAAARIAVTRRLGAIRTSMLQDVEAGRRLERGPILGCLVELAHRLQVPAPTLTGIDGLLRLRDAANELAPAWRASSRRDGGVACGGDG